MRRQFVMVISGYLVVALLELSAHWIIAQPCCRILLSLYLLHTSSGGMSIFPDFFLPVFLLGAWNGWVGRRAALRRAYVFAGLLAVGTVCLLPLYTLLIEKDLIWWWPKASILRGLFLTVVFCFATIGVAGFTMAFHKHYKES